MDWIGLNWIGANDDEENERSTIYEYCCILLRYYGTLLAVRTTGMNMYHTEILLRALLLCMNET